MLREVTISSAGYDPDKFFNKLEATRDRVNQLQSGKLTRCVDDLELVLKVCKVPELLNIAAVAVRKGARLRNVLQ